MIPDCDCARLCWTIPLLERPHSSGTPGWILVDNHHQVEYQLWLFCILRKLAHLVDDAFFVETGSLVPTPRRTIVNDAISESGRLNRSLFSREGIQNAL